jgi:hypothetical protein
MPDCAELVVYVGALIVVLVAVALVRAVVAAVKG